MTKHDHEDEEGAGTGATSGRPALRRARIAAGAAGLAVVLGVGAYTITDKLTENNGTPSDVAGRAPASTSAQADARADEVSPEPLVSPLTAGASPSSGPSFARTASPTPSLPASVAAEIRAAREDMAKHGVSVKHPPAEQPTVAPVVGLSRTTTGSLAKGGIVRVVSARSDLTGQQELAWVAGGVSDFGDDKCSQTFKLDNDPEPQEKPNLLLCWRTSAKKSVVAVVVDPKGHPSRPEALTELHKKWQSLG
jgi:hypothetical protein